MGAVLRGGAVLKLEIKFLNTFEMGVKIDILRNGSPGCMVA
jgi:hypothetical protein